MNSPGLEVRACLTDLLLNIGKQFELARLIIDGGHRGFKEGNEELGLKFVRVRPRPFLLPLIPLLDDMGDGPTLTSVIDTGGLLIIVFTIWLPTPLSPEISRPPAQSFILALIVVTILVT